MARSRFRRSLVLLAVVGVVAVGTILGTLSLGLSGGTNGEGDPAPIPTTTAPVGPRDVDASLVTRDRGPCIGDPGSVCDYGFYLRGRRTAAEQLRAVEATLGSGYALTSEFARGSLGSLRLRGGQGYVYTGPEGKTVTVYLARNADARACEEAPALDCVDVVGFEA